jgi:hypothetical protein
MHWFAGRTTSPALVAACIAQTLTTALRGVAAPVSKQVQAVGFD